VTYTTATRQPRDCGTSMITDDQLGPALQEIEKAGLDSGNSPTGRLANVYFPSGKHMNWSLFDFRGAERKSVLQRAAIVIEFADREVAGCRQNQTSKLRCRGACTDYCV
jgi:hypothetical protein